MKSRLFQLLALLFLSLFVFQACGDDEDNTEPDKAFVGKWQSRVYPSQNPTNGDTLKWEQMTFTFTNTTFEDVIAQSSGKESMTVQDAVAIKGDIESTETTMDVEVNKIAIGASAYIDKTENETAFNDAWTLALGALLNESFTANYQVYSNGDSLKLTLPTKLGDKELKLVKK